MLQARTIWIITCSKNALNVGESSSLLNNHIEHLQNCDTHDTLVKGSDSKLRIYKSHKENLFKKQGIILKFTSRYE